LALNQTRAHRYDCVYSTARDSFSNPYETHGLTPKFFAKNEEYTEKESKNEEYTEKESIRRCLIR
jgi:hypothetical protein